jgi:hypothetical protein
MEPTAYLTCRPWLADSISALLQPGAVGLPNKMKTKTAVAPQSTDPVGRMDLPLEVVFEFHGFWSGVPTGLLRDATTGLWYLGTVLNGKIIDIEPKSVSVIEAAKWMCKNEPYSSGSCGERTDLIIELVNALESRKD